MTAYFIEEGYPIMFLAVDREGDRWTVAMRNAASDVTYTLSTAELDEFSRVFEERLERRNLKAMVARTVAPRLERHVDGCQREGLGTRYLQAFQLQGVEFIEFLGCACEHLADVDDWSALSRVERFLAYVVVTQADMVDRHAERSGLLAAPASGSDDAGPPFDEWNRAPTVERLSRVRRESRAQRDGPNGSLRRPDDDESDDGGGA